MAISRDTFDPAKNYKRIRFHQDRDLLDSELNELQEIALHERQRVAGVVLRDGAILAGLKTEATAFDIGSITIAVQPGRVFVDGHIVDVPAQSVTFPTMLPAAMVVWVEVLRREVGASDDPVLINAATGEPTAEREKWIVSLRERDTSADPLPERILARTAVPVLSVDSRSGRTYPIVPQRSNLLLEDFQGTLDGSRITLGSVTEDQLSFEAAEGLHTLLQNLAERTFDESGSYVVRGLDSYVGPNDGVLVDVVTNAGRAYVRGYRLQLDLPFVSKVPKSLATKAVRGEQKTFSADTRRYPLNNRPLAATAQVEAISEITANVTRGSVGGGEDTLTPNPVVNIIEVKQGATVYRRGIDWQQSGNRVDWLGSGVEPTIGTTYSVRWTYTRQMQRGADFVDGGWFGETGHVPAGTYFYFVTAYKNDWEAIDGDPRLSQDIIRPESPELRGLLPNYHHWHDQVRDSERLELIRPILAESMFDPAKVVSRATAANEMNVLTWSPLPDAEGYRVYRATRGDLRTEFKLLRDVGAALLYIDDAADDVVATVPPQAETDVSLRMQAPTIGQAEGSIVNFGSHSRGVEPVAGSNVSIDYAYYLGRRDLLYATAQEVRRLEGAAADDPKLPAPPENTLPLGAIDCPPNSLALVVTNFGIARVTMQQLHGVLRDVEALKYNDAQFQQLLVLQNRDSQTKKGIFTDNFQNESQADPFFPGYSARIDGLRQYAAPRRTTLTTALTIDAARSTVRRFASLALLPGTEVVAIDQPEWSELRNVNPYAAFGKPPAEIRVTPNFARRLRTLVTVTGVHFNPSVSNVTVKLDGIVVASNVSTDPYGRFTATFSVSQLWRWGWRTVEASDGTNVARANLRLHDLDYIYRVERVAVEDDGTSRAIREPVAELVWDVQRRTARFDPIAQTFSFPTDRVVSAVGLTFGAKDAAHPVTVQIRGVTAGVPNEQVLAQRTLSPPEVALNAETKVVFENPVFLQHGNSYAVVVMTRSNAYRLRVATMGQRGQLSGGVIAAQVYAPGVLLESSNAETWSAVHGSDLAMKVYALGFTGAGELRFNGLSSVQFAALNLDEFSVVPQGTDLRWEYSLDGGDSWEAIVPGEEEQLPAIANRVVVRALFSSGLAFQSPVLNFHDLQLMTYLNATAGTYVTRELVATQPIASAKVYAEMSVPSGTSVAWSASNDGGATWEPMAQESARPLNDTWTEYVLGRAFAIPTGNRIRFKAVMSGTALVTPRIHSLGATLA